MANIFEQRKYTNFPLDDYTSACIIGFFFAGIKPSKKFSNDQTPVPSVKFLLAGYLRNADGTPKTDDEGKPIVVRKWTKWLTISYNKKKSAMTKLFPDIKNLQAFLEDYESGTGKLWTTPFKILVEASGEYSNITRIKEGGNADVLAITYSKEFVPFKRVKVYGDTVALTQAVMKEDEGIHVYDQDTMVEPEENGEDD